MWTNRQRLLSSLFLNQILFVLLLSSPVSSSEEENKLELNPDLKSAVRLAGEDNSFFISCIPHTGSPKGSSSSSRIQAGELQWKKLQRPPEGNKWVVMGSEPHARVHVEKSADGRGLDLVFRSIKSNDRGRYDCEAKLNGKRKRRTFHLNVIEPISFEGTPKVQTVEEGAESFTIICKVSGSPTPQITWNVRGKIIRGGNTKYEVMPNGLVIRNLTKSDEGAYKCKATQFEEKVTDFQDMLIHLRVQHKPEWPANQRGEFYGFISGTTNLTCEAKAEPPAQFRWLDKYNNEVEHGNVVSQGHKSTLTLRIDHDDLFGDYTCIARNKMGSLRKVITLTEGAKPGIPTINIYKIDHDSAEMQIQEPKAELFLKIIGFKVEYKEKNQDWINAIVVYFEKKEDEDQYKIEGLKPKTYYHIRARARNLAGFSDSSNMIYLQTNDEHSVSELMVSSGNSSASAASSSSASSLHSSSSKKTAVISLIFLVHHFSSSKLRP